MIKTFDDFRKDEHTERERKSFERELKARKIRRFNQRNNKTSIDIDTLSYIIGYAIENHEDYTLTIGKREEQTGISKKTQYHIEFEDDRIGRVRIFEPIEDAAKGYYEINGEIYSCDASKVRELYHRLMQELKGKPIVDLTEKTHNDDEI